MKTYKWMAFVCGAYLPLLVVVLLMAATSSHSKAAEHPRILRPDTQSDPGLPNAFAMSLFAPAEVKGQVLGTGEYTVEWQQDGGSIMVSFTQAGVVQAIAEGKVQTRPEPAQYSIVLTRSTASGVNTITEMHFEGKRSVLVLAQSEKPRLPQHQTVVWWQQVRLARPL